jgi:hypothetical protein
MTLLSSAYTSGICQVFAEDYRLEILAILQLSVASNCPNKVLFSIWLTLVGLVATSEAAL